MQRQGSTEAGIAMWKWDHIQERTVQGFNLTIDQKGMVSRGITTLVLTRGDVDNFSYVLRDIKWDVYFGMKRKFFRMKS